MVETALMLWLIFCYSMHEGRAGWEKAKSGKKPGWEKTKSPGGKDYCHLLDNNVNCNKKMLVLNLTSSKSL